MKRLLLAAAMALLPLTAQADVIVSDQLSGTGDNVVFEGLFGSLAVGSFNGQHQGLVDFTDLSGNALFTGAANGNDIKIANTSDLRVQVFDVTGTVVINTLTDVFSLKGSGSVTALVSAVDQFGNAEAVQSFNLGAIGNNQSGFTLTAINGEQITQYALVDSGGSITDFEHYRIDVAAPLAVPGPAIGTGLPGVVAAGLGLWALARRRHGTQAV